MAPEQTNESRYCQKIKENDDYSLFFADNWQESAMWSWRDDEMMKCLVGIMWIVLVLVSGEFVSFSPRFQIILI